MNLRIGVWPQKTHHNTLAINECERSEGKKLYNFICLQYKEREVHRVKMRSKPQAIGKDSRKLRPIKIIKKSQIYTAGYRFSSYICTIICE